MSRNDMSKLAGWRRSLSIYMSELKHVDIRALRDGVLGSPSAKSEVLDQISRNSNDPSRKLASQVLDQIEDEVRQRVPRGFMRIR